MLKQNPVFLLLTIRQFTLLSCHSQSHQAAGLLSGFFGKQQVGEYREQGYPAPTGGMPEDGADANRAEMPFDRAASGRAI